MKIKVAQYIFLLTLAIYALSPSTAALAQLHPGGSGDSNGPIAISADRMESDETQGVVHFIGQVVGRQGAMTITCDRMDVFYTQDDKLGTQATTADENSQPDSAVSAASRQIDRVECHDNVKVVEGDRLAVGNTALYLAQSLPRRIILTGDARVWQGQDSLTGHQVTYFLDNDRSLVEGGPGGRVRTMYHQEKKPK